MRCQHIERLIIESSERIQIPSERRQVEDHTASCPSCRRFRKDYERLHRSAASAFRIRLPESLDAETRRACLQEIHDLPNRPFQSCSKPVPKLIWAALLALTVITTAAFFPVVEEIDSRAPLSFTAVAMLTILLQNAAMLIFAPILLRKFRKKQIQYTGFQSLSRPV